MFKIEPKLLRLLNLFMGNNKKEQKINVIKTIFYHEDDFRQVELLPTDNREEHPINVKELDTLTKVYSDSFGTNEIFIRNDISKTKLRQLQINPNDLDQILSLTELERFSKVETGYGQHFRKEHKNCIAFGKSYCAIYYDFNDNIVEHIWLTNHWDLDKTKLASTLHILGLKWNLLLQDWEQTVTIDLKDKNSIIKYLDK